MTDVDEVATALVVTVAVPVVDPAAIVTVAGTVATDVVPEVRLTVTPPAGATPLSVTVATEVVPPGTLVGSTATLLRTGVSTLRLPVVDEPPSVAVIVEVTVDVTAVVVIVKTGLCVAPAATVTVAGTTTAELLEESEITLPPVGAAVAKVTRPLELAPP